MYLLLLAFTALFQTKSKLKAPWFSTAILRVRFSFTKKSPNSTGVGSLICFKTGVDAVSPAKT